ncbi:MAG: DUF3052 domain-containing protein [Betaproteobacteria bacterium]
MASSTAGYSGTPLARKLGIVAGIRVVVKNAPADYLAWLAPLPADVRFDAKVSTENALVHVFHHDRAALAAELGALRTRIAPAAAVWVSWPKKAAKVPTDLTEDVIREIALPIGFVDIKVCAVSDVWSGLKLVIRKELRGQPAGGA